MRGLRGCIKDAEVRCRTADGSQARPGSVLSWDALFHLFLLLGVSVSRAPAKITRNQTHLWLQERGALLTGGPGTVGPLSKGVSYCGIRALAGSFGKELMKQGLTLE